ncbi:MAG TPA: RNA recognition motif domain-containing protein [Candidatus Tripitaka sp. YC43]
MGKKLYVGNLGSSVTREMLESCFGAVGKVESVNIITDRYTGQPRGFGFVEMSSNQEAQDAITKLNGQSLGDRTIIVIEARAEERRGGGAGGAGGGGGRRGGFGGGGGGGGERRRRF